MTSARPGIADDWQERSLAVEITSLPEGCDRRLPRSTRAKLVGPRGGPLLLVLGGISANADVALTDEGKPGWWANLFGKGAPLGSDRYNILGIDFIADDSGGYAPTTFEQASIIADTLGMLDEEPAAIIGASYGGMVALAYAQRFRADHRLVIISASARPHPMATAQRCLQRQVVELGMDTGFAERGLAIARGMAMLTYRTSTEFADRFKGGIFGSHTCSSSEPLEYLGARGAAFSKKMPPGRFLSLSASIDRHLVDPSSVRAPALVIGVEDDTLVPIQDIRELASNLGGTSELRSCRSSFGHDAFLKCPDVLAQSIGPYLSRSLNQTTDTPG